MKKATSIILFLTLSFFNLQSQTAPPQKINYQGIARDAQGKPMSAHTFTAVQFIIHQGSQSGASVFTESHPNVTTNLSGVFVLQIGSINSLSVVAWGTSSFFLEVLVNDNGSGFTTLGPIQEMVSVPYALYAENVRNAPTTSITTKGVITSTFAAANNYTLAVAPPTISISGKSITISQGGFSSMDTITFNPSNLIWYHSASNKVALQSATDSVGIGTTNPQAKLDVVGFGAFPTFSVTNTNGFSYIPVGFTSGSSLVTEKVINTGAGHAVYGVQNSTLNLTSYAGFFDGGLVTKGKTNFAPAYSFRSQNQLGNDLMVVRNDGFVGIGTNLPGNRLEVVETLTANAAIFGNQTSTGPSTVAHGVLGQTSNLASGAAGVYGQSFGNGPGVYGTNTNTLTAAIYGYKSSVGNAGKFEINNGSSPSDALIGMTNGIGAAVRASCPTGAASNSLALLVENGHIKSVSSGGPVISCALCSYTTSGSFSFSGPKTDVKGKILVNFPSSGIAPGMSADIKVVFNKPYGGFPTVLITTAYTNLNYYLMSVNATDFTVRFINNTPSPIVTTNFEFNYFVIE